jgi:hypothetical protein
VKQLAQASSGNKNLDAIIAIEEYEAIKRRNEERRKKESTAKANQIKPTPVVEKASVPLIEKKPVESRWGKFRSGAKGAWSILKTEPGTSKTTKALGKASAIAPQLAPVAMLSKKMDKYNLSKKASSIARAARGAMVQKYGIKAIFKPRYWILLVSGVTLKHPFVIALVALIAAFFIMNYTFGGTSVVYEMYFIKCSITFIPNVGTTIMNSIWFGLHGMYYLILTAMLDIVNGIFNRFLSPIYDFINWLIPGSGNDVNIPFVGENFPINIQPSEGFGYLAPSPIEVKYDETNHIDIWATMGTIWDFQWMKPGAPMYGDEKVYFFSENGAQLWTPELNPDAKANGIWTDVEGKGTIFYVWNAPEMLKQWQGMLSPQQPTEQPYQQPDDQGETWTPPPASNSFLGQIAGGILQGPIQWFYNAYIEPWDFLPRAGQHLVGGG